MGAGPSFGNLGTPYQKTDIEQNENLIVKFSCMVNLNSINQQLHIIDELLFKRLLTRNYQFNLLGHGSSELVRSVASVFTLKLDEVLVEKRKSAVCEFCSLCRDMWRDKVFAIFRPSVSIGAK